MIPIPISKADEAIKLHSNEIMQFVKESQVKLWYLINNKNYSLPQLRYINAIIDKLPYLITAKERVLLKYKHYFDSILSYEIISSKNNKAFRRDLYVALRYQNLRSEILPKFFKKIGIKACVYCNAQYTISASLRTGEVKGKFQADHYFPQLSYPCFSISLYNLYPACSSCNNGKRTKEIDFALYTTNALKTKESRYAFKFMNGCVAQYLISKRVEDLQIKFFDPDKPSEEVVEHSFQDTFNINEIYDTQKDLAEELIIKAAKYKKAYKQQLIIAFPHLFNNSNLSNRILIGNYSEPENIHKRPMAKFTQDIARQLKLIK